MNKIQYAMFSQLFAFLKEKDFLNKIKVTLWMIVFYQILTYIPIPGINQALVPDIFSNKGIVGEYLDLFIGAGLGRLSIMATGITSYITVSLLFQFLTAGTEYFKELKKDSLGRVAINNYIKYLSFVHAFCFALVASYKICSNNPKLVMFPGVFFYISTSLVVATGSLITVWIADQITSRGIGNGSSIIIFVNIVCKIPSTIKYIFLNLRSGSLTYSNFFLYLILITLIFSIIVFVERINKQISVNNFYHKKMFTQNLPENYLTIKLNPAGIYPAMYLQNLVMLPFFIQNIWDFSQYKYGAIIYQSLQHKSYWFVLTEAIIIFLTSYLFAELLFNPEEKAKEFKSRTIIKGRKPGKNTEDFLKDKLFYMSFYGSFYLVIICCIPSLIHLYMAEIYVGDSYKTLVDLFAISGTSMVILVGVANDFIDKVNAGLRSKMIEYAMKMLRKGGGF